MLSIELTVKRGILVRIQNSVNSESATPPHASFERGVYSPFHSYYPRDTHA